MPSEGLLPHLDPCAATLVGTSRIVQDEERHCTGQQYEPFQLGQQVQAMAREDGTGTFSVLTCVDSRVGKLNQEHNKIKLKQGSHARQRAYKATVYALPHGAAVVE